MDEGSTGDIAERNDDAGASSSVWRFEKATRASLIVDADGYFELIREAMLKAQQSIFLIGWDFDTRIHLAARRQWWKLGSKSEYPARLGAFIAWLARRRPGLRIYILKWNFALVKSLFRGRMILDLIRWAINRRIDFKFDSAHPVGSSHHQKIVVIDDRFAVCGGIDMTSDRWDTPAHLHEDVRRMLPSGKFYAPWHDVTMLMEGDVAGALAELGGERWETAGGKPIVKCKSQEGSAWPDRLVAEFENVEIGIARTRAEYYAVTQIAEIENLFVEHIARAQKFVYAETQYFASRRIAEAIAERLDEPNPPEFVIINPRNADGWLEQQAMDGARNRLVRSVVERDHADRFRIYVPFTSGGTPIYVHAKLTIIDDEVLRVGSANMNNRSMGLDSECDVFLDAGRPANKGIEPAIERIRHSLIAEHCGLTFEDVAGRLQDRASMISMLDAAPTDGKHIERLPIEELDDFRSELADSAILDPERPDDRFEPIVRRGLFRPSGRLRKPLGRLRRRLA